MIPKSGFRFSEKIMLHLERVPFGNALFVCACPFRKTGCHFSGTCADRRGCGGSRIGQSGWIRTTDLLLPRQAGTARLPYTLMNRSPAKRASAKQDGPPSRTRTCGLRSRKPVLSSTELWVAIGAVGGIRTRDCRVEGPGSWPLDDDSVYVRSRADARWLARTPQFVFFVAAAIASSRSESSSQPVGHSFCNSTRCSLALSSWPVST
jgi:hypothetical protein